MRTNNYFFFILLFGTLISCQKQDTQKQFSSPSLCSKPPLGWNSFDSYHLYLNSKDASTLLDVMAEKYLPSGYEYFVIDAGWYDEHELIEGTNYPAKKLGYSLDEFGVYEPSKTYFPEGLKVLADKAHSLGLKFGIHLMRGIPRKAVQMNLPIKGTQYYASEIADTMDICTWNTMTYGVNMSKPGAQEWYNSIFDKFASWGIDFVKVDDMTPYPLEIVAIEKAIEHCGRPMVYSLSPGGVNELLHLPYYRKANLVRITRDIWDRKSDIEKAFDSWKKYQGMAVKGFWPDLDMIPFGRLDVVIPPEFGDKPTSENVHFSHWCRLSKDQMRTFITIRSLAASPLFIGGDLLTMDDFSHSLLTNKNMLECNQNGVMGINVYEKDSVEIWHACDANQFGKGWIGIFNRTSQDKEQYFSRLDFGLREFFKTHQTIEIRGSIQVYDIWNDKYINLMNGCLLNIPADGVIFLQYKVEEKHPENN